MLYLSQRRSSGTASRSGEDHLHPDRNLASYVQRFTQKKIIAWDGFCYVHSRFTRKEVVRAKAAHPRAPLIVHPECTPEVIDEADEVLSTSGMVQFVRESPAREFLVGTEEGLISRLRRENPGKVFYSAGSAKTCQSMKATGLEDVYEALLREQYAIEIPGEIMDRARTSLERMLTYA